MTDPIVLQSTGDVKGPASSTDNSMVLFSGTSGKVIKGNNATVTSAGLALLDDNSNTEQRNTLGLGSMATQNSNDVTITGGSVDVGSLICRGLTNVPTAPAGDSSNTIASTAFVTNSGGMPSGCIVAWAGSIASIPSGWKLCNGVGTTSTGMPIPNLTDRFILGAGSSYPVGRIAGLLTHRHVSYTTPHTLTTNEMPSHAHTIAAPRDRSSGAPGNAVWGDEPYYGTDYVTTSYAGAGQPHTHAQADTSDATFLPPHYALAFIIKN